MADDPRQYEPHPDPEGLTSKLKTEPKLDIDYEPHPERSIQIDAERQKILQSICDLYSGSASELDMEVYAEKAIYDDPYSYCDTRYKIAGQWYGIPKCMASSRTLKTEVLSSTPTELIFKLQQEYKPKVLHISKPVNSLVSLAIDEQGKVKYHKDMWNENDYSHGGIGKLLKTLNGVYLTNITKPPDSI
ncbi:hypothetical protein MMC10_005672 [Thelotrema lepadinum]|nr:hypothetical protein [Thelotrema lepadinum]